MNSSRPIFRRLLLVPQQQQGQGQRPKFLPQNPSLYFSTTPTPSALEPGTAIPGLSNIYPPAKDPSKSKVPIVLKRDEYPTWVAELAKPLPSLAKLRQMNVDDASDKDMRRYLKLVRKAKIKRNNEERAKK